MNYEQTGAEIGRLVAEKQKAYGNAFVKTGQMLEILYPGGVPVDQYQDMLAITRILDKLCRVAADNDPGGESPFTDIAGYGIVAVAVDSEPIKLRSIEVAAADTGLPDCEDPFGVLPATVSPTEENTK